MFYDAKFGRKRLPEESRNGHSNDQSNVSNGISSPAVVSNGGAHVNTSDLAIYEQYRNQVLTIGFGSWCGQFGYVLAFLEPDPDFVLFICREEARLSLMVLSRMEMAKYRMIFVIS